MRLRSWLAVLAMAAASIAAAAPVEHGEQLHNHHCTACHGNMTGGDGSALYTRDQRRVHSLAQLKKQVRRCASGKGLKWSNTEITAVTTYLNAKYYQFGQ